METVTTRHVGRPPVVPGVPVTPRQREILRFIVRRVQAGVPPTIREIAEEMGIRSPNGVICHLRALRQRGLIDLTTRHRGLGSLRSDASAWHSIRLAGARLVLEYTDDEAGRRLREAVDGPSRGLRP